MDFQALQHKLFALDPSDPKEDLAKLRGMNMGGAPQMPADPQVPTLEINESYEVTEGTMSLGGDLSINDFAALAGVSEGQKTGSAGQLKGKDAFTKSSTPGGNESPHPARNKLVGEAEEDRITSLERRIEALESMLSERELSKPETKEKERIVKGMKKNKSSFKKRYGDDAEAVMYATATKNAKKSESLDSIKDSLYAALNDRMSRS